MREAEASVALVAVLWLLVCAAPALGLSARGPLRVHEKNPRYFDDGTGRAVYLTGSHTWANFQERAYPETPQFDFEGYLDFLEEHNHNFIRLWTWEHAAWMQFTERKIVYYPNRYARTGPGMALDGLPRFDLTKFNGQHFARLRRRVAAAAERGIYVSIMLFQGFSIEQKGTRGVDPRRGNPWDGHPFNKANNINGIDGDANANGEGEETHTLALPAITRLQEEYVKKVIDTVNHLDNVLYEISNESHAQSVAWQYRMIEFIQRYEAQKPKQHPVGMTMCTRGNNEQLFASPAEWISPGSWGGYRDDPPPADGRKVILSDTDHLWGIGGNYAWVWKSFLRGLNPIFMDPYRDARLGGKYDTRWDLLRKNLGYARSYAERIDLASALPHGELCSSGYCLANPGREYVAYFPTGEGTVDLTAAKGELACEWFSPRTGKKTPAGRVKGGMKQRFRAPFAGDAVLYLAAAA